MGKFKFLAGAATAAFLAMSGAAQASVTYTSLTTWNFDNTSTVKASVTFDIVGTSFTVLLSALTPGFGPGTVAQSGVLQAVIFNGPGLSCNLNIVPGACGGVALAGLSGLVDTNALDAGTIGDNWQYIAGQGLSSAGLSGTPFPFGGGNLDAAPTEATNGSAYGLIPTGTDNSLDGMKKRTYVMSSLLFTLVLPQNSTFALSQLGDVRFVYGTNADDNTTNCVPGGQVGICGGTNVPEPGSFSLLLMALLGLGGLAFAGARRARV